MTSSQVLPLVLCVALNCDNRSEQITLITQLSSQTQQDLMLAYESSMEQYKLRSPHYDLEGNSSRDFSELVS
jgi:hypothetical protein